MKTLKKSLMIVFLLVSFVALAETIYDRKFYSSQFMEGVSSVEIETKVPILEEEKAVEIAEVKQMPRMQKVGLSQSDKVNGKWEIVRVLDDKLNPVFDKENRYEDRNSKIIVNFDLVDTSTVRINNDNDQVFNISLITKKGTIALFKPFGAGYEVLEARRVVEKTKRVVAEAVETSESLTKIEKRFGDNQELVLISALNPTKSGEILRNNKISGTAYLMGDQIMFDNLSLHIGGKDQTEPLSFEAKLDGNTGHINYNNEIQGIVSVVGNKEIRVRFSTGPLANAMLNFKVPGNDYPEVDNSYEIEQRGGHPVAPLINNKGAKPTRETASNSNLNDGEEEAYYQDESNDVATEDSGYEF